MAFCSNCGTKLNEGAKFCYKCGEKVPGSQDDTGMVSCPNCGNRIQHYQAVCEYCGFRITKKDAALSVKELSDRLYEIETAPPAPKEKKGLFKTLLDPIQEESEKDKKLSRKLTVIRSFPVPNTVEELTEFILLAESNIDVSLSKKSTGLLKIFNDEPTNDPEKKLSDAWVAKMKQIYKKAEFSFGDTSEFMTIKEIFLNKMRELHIDPDD